MDYANLIKMLMGGASGGASDSNPLSGIMGSGSKAPTAPTASPSASPASGAGGMLSGLMGGGSVGGSNPMGMLSGLLGGGSKEEDGPNPNMEMVKAAATPTIGSSQDTDEYMAKMNALRNMRNR